MVLDFRQQIFLEKGNNATKRDIGKYGVEATDFGNATPQIPVTYIVALLCYRNEKMDWRKESFHGKKEKRYHPRRIIYRFGEIFSGRYPM